MSIRKFVLLIAVLSCSFALAAQDVDSLAYSSENMELYYEEDAAEEYEPSDEEKIIQDETDAAREVVLKAEDIFSYVLYLLEADSLVNRYAKYRDNDQMVEYVSSGTETVGLDRRFDIIQQQGETPFFYCREYVFNENKAWDYIYERLYDKDGKLIFFVRQYNTYNSGCAEVAFERSEYYWDANGELIRKTYEIYDSHNNPLDIQECWMERESYDKMMNKADFLSAYPLPETNPTEETPIENPE